MIKVREFIVDLKEGFLSIFKGKSKEENLFSINGKVPLRKAIPFGIQHVLAMFVANVTPLLIVFGAIGINNTEIATQALQGSLLMAGLGTIIQLFFGARLPIVIGTSFTFVGVFITIGLSYGGGETGYYTIMGSILIGGLIAAFLSLFIKWRGKLLKPIVPCVVVFGIGLSLISSGATQFLGGNSVLTALANGESTPVPYYFYIIVSIITLFSAILFQLFAKGIWKNLNIIFAIIVGYLISLCIPNMLNFSSLAIKGVEDIITYPHLIDFSKLKFDLVPILLTTLCFLMAVVEGIGDTNALCTSGLGRKPTNREITGVLFVDGFNSAICAMFGTMPLTTFSQNVGIVSQTKIVNRFTIFCGSLLLIFASFFPILANFLFTIPESVLGGTMVILFGSIAVVGIQMCSEAGFSQKNVLILSLSLCLGFGLTLVSSFFKFLELSQLNYLKDILSNNVLNMFIIAFILSWILPDNMDISFQKNIKND